jgi:hypothetical protein
MHATQIHIPAILAAALSTFVLGGLWYSPLLFGRAWMRTNGFTEDFLRGRSSVLTFGGAAGFALVMATNLAFFLADPGTTVAWGVMAGLLAGAGWVAMAVGTIALFERRSWSYVGINAGFQVAAFALMGAILGAWRSPAAIVP